MLKRTSLDYVNNYLSNKKKWKILDLGCGYSANINANYIADVIDLSEFYKNKNFTHIKTKKLPFKNKFFDFVITSHVIEHVNDLNFFISEIQRIGHRGYIELPTRLEDNLVLHKNNIKDHKWTFHYDDNKKILIANKKKSLIEPFVTLGLLNEKLRKYYRESLVIELFWEKKIEYKKITAGSAIIRNRLLFITVFKKYCSYYLRKNKLSLIFFLFFMAYFFFI